MFLKYLSQMCVLGLNGAPRLVKKTDRLLAGRQARSLAALCIFLIVNALLVYQALHKLQVITALFSLI